MLQTGDKKLSYADVSISPAIVTTINSRSECSPFLSDGFLPLFTAPMSTVVSEDNYSLFESNRIHAILPRNLELGKRVEECIKNNKWVAFSLKEFESLFINTQLSFNIANVLIDMANGHLQRLYDLVSEAKLKYQNKIKIMVGNVANPETYRIAYASGVDYIRVSVGTGCGCITQSNTGIGYPIASLIAEMYQIKKELHSESNGLAWKDMPQIVADGGIRNYSDIIKALALGADYVMIGSVFSKMLESAAPLIRSEYPWKNCKEIDDFDNDISKIERRDGKFWYKDKEIVLYKLFYGMASKLGQNDLGVNKKTAEGVEKELKVEYTIAGWTENFMDYLKSAMSYCNTRTLDLFAQAQVIPITQNTSLSINK